MTGFLLMFDTASGDFGTVPSGAQAIAPYMDRRFANVGAARARFPQLFAKGLVATITAARGDADIVDWESGNLNPDPASWYDQQHGLGRWRPGFYEDLSDGRLTVLPRLENRLGNLGAPGPQRPVRIWTAHPTGQQHICGPNTCGQFPIDADGTQFFWSSIQGPWQGRNGDVDVSLVRDDFFQSLAKPVDLDPHRYLWFVEGKFPYHGKNLNERAIVKRYDELRATQTPHLHPHRRELAVLRDELEFLAKRVAYEAHIASPHVSVAHALAHDPVAHRGWRFQQLVKRAQGERLT